VRPVVLPREMLGRPLLSGERKTRLLEKVGHAALCHWWRGVENVANAQATEKRPVARRRLVAQVEPW